MCFDPVSMTLMAAAAGGNTIAGNAEKKANAKFQVANIDADRQQLQQNAEEAAARNAIRDKYDANAQGFANDNQGSIGDVFSQFAQPAQQQASDAAVANRTASIDAALGGPTTTNDLAFRKDTPDIVKAAYAKKLGDVFTDAQARGAAAAKVGSYGDVAGSNDRATAGGVRNVNTTNTLARGNMALLPQEQDLAGFQVRKPIFRPAAPDVPWWTGPLKMASNVAALAAGSGAGAKTIGSFMPPPTMLGDATTVYADPWYGIR